MYIKSSIISYQKKEILEMIGPAQSASITMITIETWRGVKLDNNKPAEYRAAKLLENNMPLRIEIKKDIC